MNRVFSIQNLVLAATVSFLAACGSGASSDPAPSRADCEQLRAHVVELRLSGAADEHNSAEMDKHRGNLIASLGDEFVDQCAEERTPGYVECALEASTRDELSRCR